MIRNLFVLLFFISIQAKVQQVVSLFRHGARYHLNPWYDGNSTKEMWGELTAVGMRQHQNFGKILRKEYIQTLSFLSDEFVANETDVYCTIVNRTIESARSQLYGLYPLGKGPKMEKGPSSYHLPPYSNKTDSSQKDFALPAGHLPFTIKFNNNIVITNCPNYDLQNQKNIVTQKVVYDEMVLTYQPFFKKLSSIFNISAVDMNFLKITNLYDTLTVDKFLGRPIPSNFSNDDYANLKHLHEWFMHLKLTFNISRAMNTYKLEKILSDFDGRILNDKKVLKWTFLSAHDTDIVPMLNDLNFSSPACIEDRYRKGKTDALNCDSDYQFASNLIFQLHSQNQKDFYVKIKKDGKYLYLCQTKSTTCAYNQWKKRVKNILINVDDVCFGKKINQETGQISQQTINTTRFT